MQTGSPTDIYERPNSRFVADFVGAVNLFEGELVAGFNTLSLKIAGAEQPIPLPQLPGSLTELPAGATIALALRPEKLRLSRERPAGFALAATIISIGYQGGQSTVHLATPGGVKLRAHLPSAAVGGLARGAALWASGAPADAVGLAQ